MPRKGKRQQKVIAGDPNDPDGLHAWLMRCLEAWRVKNRSERSIEHLASYVGLFIEWCEARGVTRPVQVTKPMLDRYQRHLFHMRKPNGKALTFSAQKARLVPVRAFFKWLTRQNAILSNPASEIELPRIEKRLPAVLTEREAEQVMAQPDVSGPLGVRDRAILETLYSTGIRRMEAAGLAVFDVDTERGTLLVREGKGKKDRVVPIGERACAWIEKYLGEVRPELMMPPDGGTLFLTQEGEPMSAWRVSQLVREYVSGAELGKRGACHMFRHTCATLMLEGGADIRYIQEMLGHAHLSSTQIYTQVSIRKLKAVHALTHPTAKIERPAREAKDEAPAMSEGEEVSREILPLVAHLANGAGVGEACKTREAAAELTAALAAEAAEEGEIAGEEGPVAGEGEEH